MYFSIPLLFLLDIVCVCFVPVKSMAVFSTYLLLLKKVDTHTYLENNTYDISRDFFSQKNHISTYTNQISTYCAYVHTYCFLVLERTPKYQTSNTTNIEYLNVGLSEHHILAQDRTSNMSNITKN